MPQAAQPSASRPPMTAITIAAVESPPDRCGLADVAANAGLGAAIRISAPTPARAPASVRGKPRLQGWGMVVSMLVGGPQQVLQRGERVAQHLLGRLLGVDHADALRLGAGELAVGGGDRGEEVIALELQAVGRERPLLRPRAPAR